MFGAPLITRTIYCGPRATGPTFVSTPTAKRKTCPLGCAAVFAAGAPQAAPTRSPQRSTKVRRLVVLPAPTTRGTLVRHRFPVLASLVAASGLTASDAAGALVAAMRAYLMRSIALPEGRH